MPIRTLLEAVRTASLPGLWSQGVKLVREGRVMEVATSPAEVTLRVRAPGHVVAKTVTLFLEDQEWSCDCDTNPTSPQTTAERTVAGLNNRGVVEPINYESVIALSRYDKGQLQEVRLYPIWARQNAPISRRGIASLAPPEIAQRILARLQTLSKPFGTVITIEGDVGVIRVSPGAA